MKKKDVSFHPGLLYLHLSFLILIVSAIPLSPSLFTNASAGSSGGSSLKWYEKQLHTATMVDELTGVIYTDSVLSLSSTDNGVLAYITADTRCCPVAHTLFLQELRNGRFGKSYKVAESESIIISCLATDTNGCWYIAYLSSKGIFTEKWSDCKQVLKNEVTLSSGNTHVQLFDCTFAYPYFYFLTYKCNDGVNAVRIIRQSCSEAFTNSTIIYEYNISSPNLANQGSLCLTPDGSEAHVILAITNETTNAIRHLYLQNWTTISSEIISSVRKQSTIYHIETLMDSSGRLQVLYTHLAAGEFTTWAAANASGSSPVVKLYERDERMYSPSMVIGRDGMIAILFASKDSAGEYIVVLREHVPSKEFFVDQEVKASFIKSMDYYSLAYDKPSDTYWFVGRSGNDLVCCKTSPFPEDSDNEGESSPAGIFPGLLLVFLFIVWNMRRRQ
ncbi:MAG: hypothetical protein QW728_04420 [Thermoplasmata archaeon]